MESHATERVSFWFSGHDQKMGPQEVEQFEVEGRLASAVGLGGGEKQARREPHPVEPAVAGLHALWGARI